MAGSLSGMKVAILVTNGEVRVKDRKITSCSSLRNRPPNAGAHRVDQEVVVEARKPIGQERCPDFIYGTNLHANFTGIKRQRCRRRYNSRNRVHLE